MFKSIMLTLAIGAAFSALTYPQAQSAEEFNSDQVLAWSAESQKTFIQTSLVMISVIAAQSEGSQAGCINDWYFKGSDTKAKRNAQILSAMERFPGYHPSGVILAVVQKACGNL